MFLVLMLFTGCGCVVGILLCKGAVEYKLSQGSRPYLDKNGDLQWTADDAINKINTEDRG
jgi:hypothetical protein